MSKFQSIYMWNYAERKIQIIESQIYFNLKTTYLYDSQYYSKEDEDFSLQYLQFIRELVQLNIPLENGYGFKAHYISINELFSKLRGCLQSRRKNQKMTFPPFGNAF